MRAGRHLVHDAPTSLALTIHGAAGVIDLVVSRRSVVGDLAREYAAQVRLPTAPDLYTRLGVALSPDTALADAGVVTGSVLVASGAGASVAPVRRDPDRRVEEVPGALSVLWFCVGVATALLAGWFAARTPTAGSHDLAIGILAFAAVLGILPVGRFAGHRVLAAPAFAGAAAFALAWDPAPERFPTVLGVAALVAAVTAAVGRALDRRVEEALRVWIVVGVVVFVVTGGAALLALSSQVVWALLLVGAMLAARFVPGLAIEVPDQLLIDLERLAVTAWSARDRPMGRRRRTVVRAPAVAAAAARGTRTVTAASVAVLAVVAVAAPLLLATATLPLDRIGARGLVGLAGGALLLAARSYRHAGARALLRAAGLTCWVVLLVVLLRTLADDPRTMLAVIAITLAGLMIVVAVATGRGWRSAWWSRRAEVAEGLCGSFAVASVFVAVGLFRNLWEMTS
ncbi:MAG: hypothetical protein JWM79_2208 [Nocardioides sp.]|nr:hypothetical protein [Nocardioides sp.]